jgi:hypothetical protein
LIVAAQHCYKRPERGISGPARPRAPMRLLPSIRIATRIEVTPLWK